MDVVRTAAEVERDTGRPWWRVRLAREPYGARSGQRKVPERRRHLEKAAMMWTIVVAFALAAGSKEKAEKLTCSKEVYRRLNRAVGEACKSKPLSCEESMACEVLRQRWQAMADCITARQQLMLTCFGGGDDEHKKVVDRHVVGLETCNVLLFDKNCDRSGLHRRMPVIIQVVPCTQPCKDEEDGRGEGATKEPSPPSHRGGVQVGPVPGR